MIKLILIIVLGIIFWRCVFKLRTRLMHWVSDSDQKDIETNDRVRELAWWAAIGILSVFVVVAETLAQVFMLSL